MTGDSAPLAALSVAETTHLPLPARPPHLTPTPILPPPPRSYLVTLQWSNERMPGGSLTTWVVDRAYAVVRLLRCGSRASRTKREPKKKTGDGILYVPHNDYPIICK